MDKRYVIKKIETQIEIRKKKQIIVIEGRCVINCSKSRDVRRKKKHPRSNIY